MPGAREFLDELAAAGVPMVIASSTPVRELRCALAAHGLDALLLRHREHRGRGRARQGVPGRLPRGRAPAGHAARGHVGLRGRALWRADGAARRLCRGGPHERPRRPPRGGRAAVLRRLRARLRRALAAAAARLRAPRAAARRAAARARGGGLARAELARAAIAPRRRGRTTSSWPTAARTPAARPAWPPTSSAATATPPPPRRPPGPAPRPARCVELPVREVRHGPRARARLRAARGGPPRGPARRHAHVRLGRPARPRARRRGPARRRGLRLGARRGGRLRDAHRLGGGGEPLGARAGRGRAARSRPSPWRRTRAWTSAACAGSSPTSRWSFSATSASPTSSPPRTRASPAAPAPWRPIFCGVGRPPQVVRADTNATNA